MPHASVPRFVGDAKSPTWRVEREIARSDRLEMPLAVAKPCRESPRRCARTCRRCFGLEATKRRNSSPRIRWSALFSSSPYENHEPHARHRIASSPRGFSGHSSACPRQSGHCRDIEWPMRAGSTRVKFLRAFSTEDYRKRGASCDSRPHPSREIGRGSPVRRKGRRARLRRILMDCRSHCPAARVRDRSR